MAAKKDKYDKLHDKELAALLRELDAIYADLANEIGSIGATYASSVDKTIPFVLSKYPLIQKRVDAVLKKLAKRVKSSVVNGVKSVWTLANQKNNELCRLVFGAMLGQLTKEQERKYYTSNDAALQAFLQRKVKGMNLSERVWNYSDMCKHQIEATLELGIKTGESAAEMATDLKTYLKYPDKLFRRVRGADGNLHLSKAAAQFHPGQGVYRSSYQNAYRLARTETNMAYRSADYLRRTQLDFVVGIEIHLSNNHTCLGRDGKPHPFHDICDELQGKYPKWFDFKGWHPACRCFTTSILKTDEEIERDMDGVDRGSVNTVKKMPPQWDKWLEKNRERVDMAAALGRLPYFLNDNPWAWQEGVEMPGTLKPALQRANERHMARTPEQVADIKRRWNERQIAYNDAKMVLKLVDSVPDLKQYWEDHDSYYSNMVNRVRKMYETGSGYKSYGGMRIDLYEILDEIKSMRDKLKYLADPFKAMQDHGLENARAANAAVEHKLLFFDSHGDLDWKIKKLKFEIDWLDKPENQKYSTWKVAQDAYKKALEEAELEKFWKDSGSQYMQYMSTAKAEFPSLYAKMRVAYKNKDASGMVDLITEVKNEQFWAQQRTLYEHIKNNYPIAYKLEQNNDQFTFMTDMEYALAKRLSLKFKKAYDAAVQAIGPYNGYKVTVTDLYDELVQHGMGSSDAAKKLDKAATKANIDELVEAIKEAKWVLEWAERKEEYQSYRTNIAAAELDEKNKFGYLDAMKKAIDDQEEYPYNEARKKLDAAISKFNGYVNDAIKLIARLNNVGENKAALDLERVVDEYVLTDIVKALKKAEEVATWGELKKRADEVLRKENKEILVGLGLQSYIDSIQIYLDAKDAGWLKSMLHAAEEAIKEWKELRDKALDLAYKNSLPAAIDDEISDAIDAIDKVRLEKVIQRAENYVNIFGPLKKELTDLEGQKPELKKALDDRKAELKKQRADIATRRKEVKAEEDRLKALYPYLSEKELKMYSQEWRDNEEKRKKVNADAKSLRANEAMLDDCVEKFDKWDDAVSNAQLYIEQEDKKQARLFVDILSGIASDINHLSGNAANLAQLDNATVDALLKAWDVASVTERDDDLRPSAEKQWATLSADERLVITKYTETYSYLNEPLRGITYGGRSTGTAEFNHDCPLLTAALEKCGAPADMVVRRGTSDYFIPELGKRLSEVKVGDEFVEPGFLSTAVQKYQGFFRSYNLIIVMPKGTPGYYAETCSYYNGHDPHGNYYSSGYNAKKNIWDGKFKPSRIGGEQEWIGSRGYKFRVYAVSGSTITLVVTGIDKDYAPDGSPYHKP